MSGRCQVEKSSIQSEPHGTSGLELHAKTGEDEQDVVDATHRDEERYRECLKLTKMKKYTMTEIKNDIEFACN